jgi:hypothetical protein
VRGRLFWHVSSSLNRASITAHGLDWRRMRITGVAQDSHHPARSLAPELDAVFLCETLDDVEFFVGFGQHPLVDVWEVDGAGLATVPAPDGWVMCRAAIGPERLRLYQSDRMPDRRPLCTVALVFRSRRLTVAEMSALAGIEPDAGGRELCEPIDDLEAVDPFWWWLIEGSDRYAPFASQVSELATRIAGAEDGLTRLAAEADEGEFIAQSERESRALPADVRALIGRIGVATGDY